jgi:hypothetical protein
MFDLTPEEKDFAKLVVKAGIVGTFVGLPLALYMRRAISDENEHKSLIIAGSLTALGLGIKEYYFHSAHGEEDIHSPLPSAQVA